MNALNLPAPSGRPIRESFSKLIPDFQIAWDSTSLGTLKKCPRKYQLSIVEGWRRKGSSLHLRFGIIYHKALEVYDHKIAEGAEHEAALISAVRVAAEMCVNIEYETVLDEYGVAVLNEEGVEVTREVRKWWETGDPNKNVANLLRTIIWYLDKFGVEDPAKTVILANGTPAVELSFRFEVGEVSGETLLLCGHLDRVVEFNGQTWVLDRKTTKTTITGYSAQNYFAQYDPNNQMTLYSLAGKMVLGAPLAGVIIDAAQVAVGFSEFARGFTTRSEETLEEWMESFSHYVMLAKQYAISGFWPMNDTACSDYGGCEFRGICSKSPKIRTLFLESDFHREYWDPLQVRGNAE